MPSCDAAIAVFQLSHLPLSFHQLTSLRWLDLKNNQLSAQLAAAAGECLNPKECEQCARRVVQFMGRVKEHYDQERMRREQHERGGHTRGRTRDFTTPSLHYHAHSSPVCEYEIINQNRAVSARLISFYDCFSYHQLHVETAQCPLSVRLSALFGICK